MGLKETILEVWENVVSPMFAELGAEVDVEALDPVTAVDPLYGEAVAQKEYTEPVVLKARAEIEKDRLVGIETDRIHQCGLFVLIAIFRGFPRESNVLDHSVVEIDGQIIIPDRTLLRECAQAHANFPG